MGSSASKAARTMSAVQGGVARKYPTQASAAASKPVPEEHRARSMPIEEGGISAANPSSNSKPDLNIDHDLDARLRRVGPVQPSVMTSSTPGTSISETPSMHSPPIAVAMADNPAVSLLAARYQIASEAEREFEKIGKSGFAGRHFVDARTLSRALAMRDEARMGEAEIEQRLGLAKGLLSTLGGREMVSSVGYEERA